MEVDTDSNSEDFAVRSYPEKDYGVNASMSDSEVIEIDWSSDENQEVQTQHLNNEVKFSDPRLKSVPIVYTTRLDDIIFLRKLNNMSITEITNTIEKDSTPELKKYRPSPKPYSIHKFAAIKRKLNKINATAACHNSESANATTKTGNLETQPILETKPHEEVKQYKGKTKCEPAGLAQSTVIEAKSSKENKNNAKTEFYKRGLLAELFNERDTRNTELWKLCKPLSVVLQKLETNYLNDLLKPQVKKYDKIQTNYLCFVFKNMYAKETEIYCLTNGKMTLHYTVKTLNDAELIPYMQAHCSLRVFKPTTFVFCCWHQREKSVNALCPSSIKREIVDFLKKPHKCAFGMCTCCCQPANTTQGPVSNENTSDPDWILPEDIEIKDLEEQISETIYSLNKEYGYNKDWLQELHRKTKENSNSLVNNAFTNQSCRQSQPILTKSTFIYESKSYLRLFTSENGNKHELFELQGKGDLVAYFKDNVSSKSSADDKYKYIIDRNITHHPPNQLCCWYKREQTIRSFHPDDQKLAKFLKLPHACLPGRCKCCCKPGEGLSTVITKYTPKVKQNVPEGKVDANEKITKSIHELMEEVLLHEEVIKKGTTAKEENNNSSMQTESGKAELTKNIIRRPVNIIRKSPPSNNMWITNSEIQGKAIVASLKKDSESTSSQKSMNTKVQQTKTVTNMLLTKTGSQSKSNKNSNHSKVQQAKDVTNMLVTNSQSQVKAVVAPLNKVSECKPNSNSHNNQEQQAEATPPVGDFTVDSMITTILDRFKDVRLTINEDGKVAAALNAPVNTLSTSELKVLANILAHAQKQVKALGLSPGSTVNASDLKETVQSALQNSRTEFRTCNESSQSTSKVKTDSAKENTLNSREIQPQSDKIPPNQCNETELPDSEILDKFSKINREHKESFISSYLSYVQTKAADSFMQIPKITNVFSLNDDGKHINDTSILESKSSALQAWSSTNESKSPGKRKSVDSEPKPFPKIRVVDPAKLGITADRDNETTLGHKVHEEIYFQLNDSTTNKINNNSILHETLTYSGNQNVFAGLVQQMPPNEFSHNPSVIGHVVSNVCVGPESNPTPNTPVNGPLLVFNPMRTFIPNGPIVYSQPNSNNLQYVSSMNSIAQNIQMLPLVTQTATAPVFHIGGPGASTSEPRLLNAAPVERPKRLAVSVPQHLNTPATLTRIAPRPKASIIMRPSRPAAPKPKPKPKPKTPVEDVSKPSDIINEGESTIKATMSDGMVVYIQVNKDEN